MGHIAAARKLWLYRFGVATEAPKEFFPRDVAFADIHPQATLDWSNSSAPDRGVYVGYDAWRAFMQARDEALAERRFESVELLAPSDDKVVMTGVVQERGRASGIEVESRGAAVWTLSEGKVEEAARLLGLSRKGLYLKRQRLQIE